MPRFIHIGPIWDSPKPRPLHVQLYMRIRYCPRCHRVFGVRRLHGRPRWRKPVGRKYLCGNIYNGPFTPVCAICVQSLKRIALYRESADQRAYQIAAAFAARDRRSGFKGAALTIDQVHAVLAAGACAYCGVTTELSIDHIIPRSRGGSHSNDNLACACVTCNSAKRAMTSDEFCSWIVRVAAHLGKSASNTQHKLSDPT